MFCHPSPDGLFILDTNASGIQIRTALSKVQDRVAKPICFAMHDLLKQHRNFCTTHKELLFVVNSSNNSDIICSDVCFSFALIIIPKFG